MRNPKGFGGALALSRGPLAHARPFYHNSHSPRLSYMRFRRRKHLHSAAAAGRLMRGRWRPEGFLATAGNAAGQRERFLGGAIQGDQRGSCLFERAASERSPVLPRQPLAEAVIHVLSSPKTPAQRGRGRQTPACPLALPKVFLDRCQFCCRMRSTKARKPKAASGARASRSEL